MIKFLVLLYNLYHSCPVKVNKLVFEIIELQSTMSQGQYLFCLLYINHFNYLARKYGGNRYVKHFSCRNHLLSMMFRQLSNCESLRDVVVALESHHSKCKFLGIGRQPIDKFHWHQQIRFVTTVSRGFRLLHDELGL